MADKKPTERLALLDISLPTVATPVGSYAPAIRDGKYVYTSGQLPFIDGDLPARGHVGDNISVDQAMKLAEISALNAIAAATTVANIDQLYPIKVAGFVASAAGFTGQPGVINGASDLLAKVFANQHARSAVGVAELPMGSPVEVEIIFRIDESR